MKKCKVCGECFAHHVSNAHISKHGLTRKEYNAINEREDVFSFHRKDGGEYSDYKFQQIASAKAKSSAVRCFGQV